MVRCGDNRKHPVSTCDSVLWELHGTGEDGLSSGGEDSTSTRTELTSSYVSPEKGQMHCTDSRSMHYCTTFISQMVHKYLIPKKQAWKKADFSGKDFTNSISFSHTPTCSHTCSCWEWNRPSTHLLDWAGSSSTRYTPDENPSYVHALYISFILSLQFILFYFFLYNSIKCDIWI